MLRISVNTLEDCMRKLSNWKSFIETTVTSEYINMKFVDGKYLAVLICDHLRPFAESLSHSLF